MGKRKAKHLQFKIWLDDIEPQIWRRVLVPAEITLHERHRIIQLLFEWYDYHLYEFMIGERRYQEPDPEAEVEVEDSTRARLRDLGLAVGDEFTYLYDSVISGSTGFKWSELLHGRTGDGCHTSWEENVEGLPRTVGVQRDFSGSWRRSEIQMIPNIKNT